LAFQNSRMTFGCCETIAGTRENTQATSLVKHH
jgi:hypothetical protein